jgi:hypothetical protein
MGDIMAATADALGELVTPTGRPKTGGLYATALEARDRLLADERRLVRWSPTVGQFDGLVKLGPGCRQAANLIMSPTL